MKVTYYVASSLDGYIAKQDGDVSWLEELNISMEDTGYNEFYSTVDALVMGA
jgi:dihydrofolate reductase